MKRKLLDNVNIDIDTKVIKKQLVKFDKQLNIFLYYFGVDYRNTGESFGYN